jgi:hypothetical protein
MKIDGKHRTLTPPPVVTGAIRKGEHVVMNAPIKLLSYTSLRRFESNHRLSSLQLEMSHIGLPSYVLILFETEGMEIE